MKKDMINLISCMLFVRCACIAMVWIPNTEGLFSQFLQLSIMMFVRNDLNIRSLTVPALNTTHSKILSVCLCKVFQLPAYVRCIPVQSVNTIACRQNSIDLRRYYYYSNEQSNATLLTKSVSTICYNMISPFLGGQTRRDAFLRVISLIPQLDFHSKYRELFWAYKRNLLELSSNSYTVVHWRRGDQLTSRCAQGKDHSVNCMSVQDLVVEIQRYTSDKVIYLATNEANLSHADLECLKHAGVQVFDPLVANYPAGSLAAVVVDVQLMLDATTFLCWGVSVINDLVEHARMVHNKTWCTVVETNVTYPTWCWLQEQRLLHAHLPAADTHVHQQQLARRKILLQVDQYMHTHPLVLSEYNITNMPVYQFEIEDAARRMKNLFV